MCTFQFKLWWITQRMGSYGKDIPFETQFHIVEGNDGSRSGGEDANGSDQPIIYTMFLPILEGAFRDVLQGNENDEIEICLESGDPAVDKFEGTHLVFVAAGPNPFDVITNAVKVYIGSCTGGKTEDFLSTAKVFLASGKKVKVPTFLVPVTHKVWMYVYALPVPGSGGKTCSHIFEEAGYDVPASPSCGACLGGPRDTYARMNEPQFIEHGVSSASPKTIYPSKGERQEQEQQQL